MQMSRPGTPSRPSVTTKDLICLIGMDEVCGQRPSGTMDGGRGPGFGPLPCCTSSAPWRYPLLQRSKMPLTWKLRRLRIGVAAPGGD